MCHFWLRWNFNDLRLYTKTLKPVDDSGLERLNPSHGFLPTSR